MNGFKLEDMNSIELTNLQWLAVMTGLQRQVAFLRGKGRLDEDIQRNLDIIWAIRTTIFTEEELKDVPDVRAPAD
jgi:hypothetical protein